MVKSTKAPVAPQQETSAPVSAAPTNAALQVVYKAGKPYNVRPDTAQDNARTWDALSAKLSASGGQCTRADLVAVAQQFNHAPFVGYAIRRGWLAPA